MGSKLPSPNLDFPNSNSFINSNGNRHTDGRLFPKPLFNAGTANKPVPSNGFISMGNCYNGYRPTFGSVDSGPLQDRKFLQNDKFYPRNQSWNNSGRKKNFHSQKDSNKFIDFCEACNRGFKTVAKKEEHYSQHKKCKEPGCNFEAHFKLVDQHWKTLHGTKAFAAILNEDDEQWRAARRKNFPTRARVEEKKKKENERKEKGAVLQPEHRGKFGKKRFRKNKNQNNNQRGRQEFPKSSMDNNQMPSDGQKTASDQKASENCDDPLSFLANAAASIAAEDGDEAVAQPVAENASSCDGLKSLLTAYSDSDGESANKNCIANPPKTTVQNLQAEKKALPVKNEESSPPKDNSKRKQANSSGPAQKKSRPSLRNQKREKSLISQPSLLQKLLSNQMRQERNTVLQCIRYIVNNDFFSSKTVNTQKEAQ